MNKALRALEQDLHEEINKKRAMLKALEQSNGFNQARNGSAEYVKDMMNFLFPGVK